MIVAVRWPVVNTEQSGSVGEYIRELRKAAKLTQPELEKRSGVPQRTISRVETTRTEGYLPEPHILRAIARALKVPVRDLLRAAGYDDETDDVRLNEVDNARTRVFGSRSHLMTEEQWEIVRNLIEEFTRE